MLRSSILSVLLFCSVAWGNTVSAQVADSSYVIGHRFTVASALLKENRKYWVRLPKGYNDTEKYPVIYVLDGEMYFPIVCAEQGFLDGNSRLSDKKCIVVGIENTDRTRDLTPTPAVSAKGQATLENSGKGEAFFQFIRTELIPSIEKQYHTANRRILVGHSFGGLAATYCALRHPDCFTDYLIIEPALWWDDGKLLKQAKNDLSQNQYPHNCHVFLGFARTKEATDTQSLDHVLSIAQPKNIALKSQYYPDESHGTVYVHALYDGLRYILDIPIPKKGHGGGRE
ncbi:MAG: alpha/beta hydrolase-fold protein [Chitinophagaceae bacterium]